jgi:hypothetical protein
MPNTRYRLGALISPPTKKALDKSYTVIGMYADNQQPWMGHVKSASDPKDAAIKATLLQLTDSGADPDDMFVVEVIEGRHTGTLNNDCLLSLKALKEHTL